MNFIQQGTGRPLLLIHGLGGSWRTWLKIIDRLTLDRQVFAIDLPGHGDTPPLVGRVSIDTLADAVSEFLVAHDLVGVDVVGTSMGARIALELARRGFVGSTVAISPFGFGIGMERVLLYVILSLRIRLVRLFEPALSRLAYRPLWRARLFGRLSAQPRRLPTELALAEIRAFASIRLFNGLLYQLAFGPIQQGAERLINPIVIGWGRMDSLTPPRQAKRALARFPNARLYWFDQGGHYCHWDAPAETVQLILVSTARGGNSTKIWERQRSLAANKIELISTKFSKPAHQ